MAAQASVSELLGRRGALLSVEFFPPKNEDGGRQIVETAGALRAAVQPAFVSITYGAGGTTRERTYRYARLLKDEYGFAVMPHLTCVGSTRAELAEIVAGYAREGFRNLMCLRGDPPKGETTFQPSPDGLRYGGDLVALVREVAPEFCLGVGGYPEKHPEASSPAADLAALKAKVEAGANFVTTQLFFDNAAYFDFVARCRAGGLMVPILPGLLPVLSLAQVQRFCAMCGARLPAELAQRLAAAGDDPAAVEQVGVDWAFEQITGLLAGGAPGVHLYILNRARSALELAARLAAAGLWRG